MARKKEEEVVPETVAEVVIPTLPAKLAIDYPSEGLNNMARKINEIIDHLYAVRER